MFGAFYPTKYIEKQLIHFGGWNFSCQYNAEFREEEKQWNLILGIGDGSGQASAYKDRAHAVIHHTVAMAMWQSPLHKAWHHGYHEYN